MSDREKTLEDLIAEQYLGLLQNEEMLKTTREFAKEANVGGVMNICKITVLADLLAQACILEAEKAVSAPVIQLGVQKIIYNFIKIAKELDLEEEKVNTIIDGIADGVKSMKKLTNAVVTDHNADEEEPGGLLH